jgi:predicted glutamine amidotransferase
MCELFCLSSRIPTAATFSLQRFAARGGCGSQTIDGWGLAFYDGRDVRLYREPEPACHSAWLAFIENRKIASTTVISHIRRAMAGRVVLENTQPFIREMGGHTHCFAHNGFLPGIETLRTRNSPRFRPIGDTDSEIAFCALLEQLSPLWAEAHIPGLDERLSVVSRFAAAIRQFGPANFFYADGDVVFAHGDRRTQADGTITPPGLWRLQSACPVDRDALVQSGVTIEPKSGPQKLTLIASVPLSDEAWVPLARGDLFAVKDGAVWSALPARSSGGTGMC